MEYFELGQVVFSKRGRDRDTAYVVVGTLEESGKQYALLADGNRRMADNPKKKKLMHIQPTKTFIQYESNGDVGARNAYLRKSLSKYVQEISAVAEN